MANNEASVRSHYAAYVKAREGFDTIEEAYGFATFKISGDECYLRDIYVVPEMRRQHGASDLCNRVLRIAKEAGCKFLLGSVQPSVPGSTESIKAVLGYGFKLFSSQNDFIIFKLDI